MIHLDNHSQQRVLRALALMSDGRARPELDLATIAAEMQLSPAHAQKLFKRWVGLSPKAFLQALTLKALRERILQEGSLEHLAWDCGLSGGSRLYDLVLKTEACTPGSLKRRGQGLEIRYGIHSGPFGEFLLATSDKGICFLGFLAQRGSAAGLEELRSQFPLARLLEDREGTREVAEQVFPVRDAGSALSLHLLGTPFQLKVWEALLRIPDGQLTTYQEIARACGQDKASRAVGGGVGANPVSWLIPCHRVIRKMGLPGHYRWGAGVKQSLLAWEGTRRPGESSCDPEA